MAPSKRAPKIPESDDSDDDNKPSWDSNTRNLRLYLLKLQRWITRQHKQFPNFIRYGFTLNAKSEVIVFDDKHQEMLQDGSLPAGSFEAPCKVTNRDESSEEDASESEDELEEEEADTTAPLSSAAIRRHSRTPGLRGTDSSRFRIAPEALHAFDEECLNTILDTIDDEETQDEMREECENSALSSSHIFTRWRARSRSTMTLPSRLVKIPFTSRASPLPR